MAARPAKTAISDCHDRHLLRRRLTLALARDPTITRTNVAGGSTLPCPTVTSSAVVAPLAAIAAPPRRVPPPPAPPSSRSARHLRAAAASPTSGSRSSGATARALATSNTRLPASSSARPRSTSTFCSFSASTHSSRKTVRRSNGSSRVTVMSCRTIARTMSGQTGTRADVDQAHARGDGLGHDGAVEQVAVPDARHLARAQQPAHHSGSGQQLGERLCPIPGFAGEDVSRDVRRRR